MKEHIEYLEDNKNSMKSVADILFTYLRDVIYDPARASLDLKLLPEEFQDFGKGLMFFSGIVNETTELAKGLASGNLNYKLPPPSNEIAAPLKMLHASLRHLTWQTQQVAKGDYRQHVDFMGDFSEAFNNMIKQLEQRQKIYLDEKSKLKLYVELMLANYPDPVLLFDRQGQLIYVSDSYLKCCQITEVDGILGKQIGDLFSPFVSIESICTFESLFQDAVREKHSLKIEQDIDLSRKGSYRHYQVQVAPMLDIGGNAEGIIMILYDTTEIMRAQHEAEHARELAEQSSRSKTDFLARMSHEMRTPMNAIIGMTAIYDATDDPNRKDYCIEKINEASRHLLGVINDILDMSNIETEKFELTFNKFNFEKMIERVTGSIMFSVKGRKQQLSVNIDPSIPKMVFTDEQRISQVITNLLSNAVKFTPNEGEISLTAKRISEVNQSCVIQFTVKDNGIGISKEQQKGLFLAFEQADGGMSRKYGGIGLGLAISKRIVDMIGGNIWVESEAGIGASFIFEIPVEKAESHDFSQLQSISSDRNPSETDAQNSINSEDGIFSGLKILLAEDVEINREILISLIEHTEIQIDSANDGLEALEKFVAAPEIYSLVLMDIHMPNMDGYETTKRIRSSGLPGAETIPIIALTANVFREDVERCLKCGMNSHLGKPIDVDELIARLKEYLL